MSRETTGPRGAPSTPRTSLLAIDAEVAAVLDEGEDRFEAAYGVCFHDSGDLARTVIHHTLDLAAGESRPWGGYLGLDHAAQRVVGTCAFKAPPTVDGVVEIAYFTFPGFEGRGYATEMARGLIALAEGSPLVRRIIAHTLPEPNASTRILQKLGLRWVGEVIDPEDGAVWEWELLVGGPPPPVPE